METQTDAEGDETECDSQIESAERRGKKQRLMRRSPQEARAAPCGFGVEVGGCWPTRADGRRARQTQTQRTDSTDVSDIAVDVSAITDDVSDIAVDVSAITDVSGVSDITVDVSGVSDITDMSDITNVSDVSPICIDIDGARAFCVHCICQQCRHRQASELLRSYETVGLSLESAGSRDLSRWVPMCQNVFPMQQNVQDHCKCKHFCCAFLSILCPSCNFLVNFCSWNSRHCALETATV